ncbi:hypothetical protein ADUPG1_000265 [Aduncisulcus paluster]|uniref:Uncharacterized protein n=1 Tax=Aduncisulcus paluster TaxID=2918883 RepID=A0ABQ5K7G3_9EUKA|nr:hypothetical protein ADUPG1_000265 [Aduncisulcus paluster]|eukprot:gnl/Carplike_NY0171/4561_a6201_314.p1 GENE.gnl/Carplike_NY0171/4561_a6201_314~~gnl/Carplike_NY0171/4561_a6201_314.p1  ORF type:complete len:141 (-),score=13.23 gnl/Carplike_NY0171/4561_a6201_314:51-473(-)
MVYYTQFIMDKRQTQISNTHEQDPKKEYALLVAFNALLVADLVDGFQAQVQQWKCRRRGLASGSSCMIMSETVKYDSKPIDSLLWSIGRIYKCDIVALQSLARASALCAARNSIICQNAGLTHLSRSLVHMAQVLDAYYS